MDIKKFSDCVEKLDIKCDGGDVEKIDGGVACINTAYRIKYRYN